ncbi:a-factor receptor [Tulasnella sp. UAMH 9824]|nr:a-factor receptor [Tulasnella sp. UAMH 9824]
MVYLPPILINIVSSVYAFLAIRAFLKQRKQLSAVLASSHSGLTIGQYFRLVALAATQIICSLPISIYLMVTNIQRGLAPWISWEDTHQGFNRVDFFPLSAIKTEPRFWVLLNLTRYMLPVSSFLFFIYLGISGESGTFYRKQFWRLAGVFGFSAPSKAAPVASWIALPRTATTASVSSTTKETSSMDYPSRPLSFPPKFDGKKGSEADHTFRLQASPEVHPSLA